MDKLSAENLLKHVRQEDVLSYYLGFEVEYNKKFKNPFRRDRHADCCFTVGSKYINFKDFAQPDFGGNLFKVCALHYGLILPRDFYQVCQRINDDLQIGLDDGYMKDYQIIKREEPSVLERTGGFSSSIHVRTQNFTQRDLDWWGQYYITEESLKKYDVYRAEKVWIDEKEWYFYQEEDLCYAYWFPTSQTFKIYKPLEVRNRKWRTNSRELQGYCQLTRRCQGIPEREQVCFITKSLKDVMVLDILGYAAVAVQAEGHFLEENEIIDLTSRFKEVRIFFDNDEPGKKSSWKLTEKYNLKHFNIPDVFEEKDASDFVRAYSMEEMNNLIKQKINV